MRTYITHSSFYYNVHGPARHCTWSNTQSVSEHDGLVVPRKALAGHWIEPHNAKYWKRSEKNEVCSVVSLKPSKELCVLSNSTKRTGNLVCVITSTAASVGSTLNSGQRWLRSNHLNLAHAAIVRASFGSSH